MLHLGDAAWVRLVCTANPSNTAAQNHYVALQWSLYDARAGVDAWKFLGDSITANAMGHAATNDAFDQLVARQAPNMPAFEMAGHAFWKTDTALNAAEPYLASFPGRFVALSLGTNDEDPASYRTHLRELVDKVLAAGKQPVIPTVPYTGEPSHLVLIPRLNAAVRELYASYGSSLIVGPDLYDVLYQGREVMFDQPTDLHPNKRGNAAIRQAWADAMVARLYR
jgi:lysophospholipase L1-like esterase